MDQATEHFNFEKKVVVDGHTKRIPNEKNETEEQ